MIPKNSIYDSAINLLTIREHSALELSNKLSAKGCEIEDILPVIKQLQQQNLQSDKRFSEMLIRSRFNQGKGSLFVKNQLKQHNITNYDLDDCDFYQLSSSVRLKKYGIEEPKNYQEKAKQMRFLQSRGFSLDEINFAMNS